MQKNLVVCSAMVKNVNDDQIVSYYVFNPFRKPVELRTHTTIMTDAESDPLWKRQRKEKCSIRSQAGEVEKGGECQAVRGESSW